MPTTQPRPLRALLLTSLQLALCASVARADRPLVSETADVIGAGDCQLEAAVGRRRESEAPSPLLLDQGGSRWFGVATRELGKDLLGHLNLGWLRTGRNRLNHTTWSLGIEGDSVLGWAADVFGDDRSRPWASGGVILPLNDGISANLAYAQQFESPRVHLWTLGLKIEFQ